MINTCFHGNCSVNHWGLCLSSQLFTSNRIIDGAIKEGDWKNIIKHDGALNSFTKAKGGESIIRCKSCSVIFKSLLKSSDWASEISVGLYQKSRSIKKVIVRIFKA